MRIYRLERGPNWYLFYLPSEMARTLPDLSPGELKLTIEEMTAEQFFKAAPATNIPAAAHIDGLSSKHPLSSDR